MTGQDEMPKQVRTRDERLRRLRSAFMRSVPVSGVIAMLLFGALYYHDAQSDPLVVPGFRMLDALGEELRSESGNLMLCDSDSDGTWVVSRRLAQPDDYDLLEKTGIINMLDHGDFAFLKAAFEDSALASAELRRIAEQLKQTPESDEESECIIREAAATVSSLREQFLLAYQCSAHRPIFFNAKPQLLIELHLMAEQEVVRLEGVVDELKSEAAWESAQKPIGTDLARDNKRRNKLIRLGEQTCRISRMCYVLNYAALGDCGYDTSVRDRLIKAQLEAERITSALANDPSLDGSECVAARRALEAYAHSMQRRLWKLRPYQLASNTTERNARMP